LEEYAACTNISEEPAASLFGAEEYFSNLKAEHSSKILVPTYLPTKLHGITPTKKVTINEFKHNN